MSLSPPEPWQMSAGALAAAYAAQRLSPVEAFDSIAARLRTVQPLVNAVVCRDEEGARAAARESERRWSRARPLSLLDGVPLTVKDNIPVRGLPCRWGSRVFAQHVPQRDELPVARVRAAGAVILGKTNVPEFTLQGYTDNLLAGATRNPWDLALTPGGSSGGAVAAVAAGVAPLALATDGGGSIRRPCSHTGLVGLKPSWGRVPRADGLPEMLPGLEVIGPVARTVGDLERLLAVIGPRDEAPARTGQPRRIVCWRAIGASPVDAEVVARLEEAIAGWRILGHEVVVADAPQSVARFNREAWPVFGATGLAAVLEPIARAQGVAAVEAQLTPAMADLWATGRALPATALFAAQQLVRSLRSEIDALLQGADAILTPAAGALPWPARESHPPVIAGQAVDARGHAVFTAFVNACGLPALALPLSPSAAGLPIGMQLVGRRHDDDALLALGLEWEQLRPWADRWPPLAALSPEHLQEASA